MKNKSVILGVILIILCSCEWKHDPSKPYPNLSVGEYWIHKFDQRGLQNARVSLDRLFCNTINIAKGQNYLYCLSLKNGKVLWKVPVEAYASQPVEIYDNEIFFSTYVGHIYKISIDGNVLWKTKFPSCYSGHQVNPINGNLIVNSVVNGAFEFDNKTGMEIYHYHFKNKSGVCSLTEPIIYQDQIIFGDIDVDSTSSQKGFIGLEYKSKRPLWKCILDENLHGDRDFGLLNIKNYLFVQSLNGELFCIDIEQKSKLWSKKITNKGWIQRFKVESDKLIYYNEKAIALDMFTGDEIDYTASVNLSTYEVKIKDNTYKIEVSDKIEMSYLGIEIKKI